MKVLFLMIAYPDLTRTTNMYTDLTSEFLNHGHDVYVVAPAVSSTKLGIEGGVNVLRVKTLPLFNVNPIRKGIANMSLPYLYKIAIYKYLKYINYDLVITSTPPITFNSLLQFLKRKFRVKTYLILRDIFPQNAKDIGILNNPLLFKYFRKKEKQLYKLADSIGCMSPGNIEYVVNHNPEIIKEKLHLLPNWMKINENVRYTSKIKKKFNLENKFVAIFGGNLGLPQKIDFLIEVAEKIKENKSIVFFLIGNGTEKKRIERLIQQKELNNVIVKETLPREEYLALIKECEVGLVNLSDKFTIPNIPSRTLSYWAVKLPVLAAIDKSTDFPKMLEEANGGLYSFTGDCDNFINNLLFLYHNPEKRKQIGENGYHALINKYNVENAYKQITKSIQ
jgi:glycosyltransferase involved in cell wall biosynthesis